MTTVLGPNSVLGRIIVPLLSIYEGILNRSFMKKLFLNISHLVHVLEAPHINATL